MIADLLSTALVCIKGGMSILPIDHSTKRPAMHLLPRGAGGKPTWKPYQQGIADEATVREWFKAGIRAIGVVGGAVSSGLLVLDFDDPAFYERWTATAGNLAEGLPVQQTGGGGYQVLLLCPDPGGNDKLAWKPDEQEETGRTVAIETRGEGGYAVIAPSRHPSGNCYRWLAGSAANVPKVTQECADKLLAAARALDEAPHTRQERQRIEAQARDAHQKQPARRGERASVIDAFNQQSIPIESMLERLGYTKGSRGRYIRPGGKSESVSVKDGRSFHWSSNDPLNDGRGRGGCGCHDAFDLFAQIAFAGDVSKAVKSAAKTLGMSVSHGRQNGQAVAQKVWPDPQQLPAGLPPVLAFDFDLLPAAFRPWIQDVAERMQCPPDYCAATAIIVAGALIGRKVAIRPKRKDDWQVVPNLFGAMVGRPSLLKSPAMKEILKYLARLEVEAKEEFARLVEEHEAAALVAEATAKVKKEAIKKAVKDGTDAKTIAQGMVGENSDPPTRRRHLVNDTTVEKLGVILAENPNGVLIYVDELASFFRVMDREGHEGDRGFYLTAWAGDSRYTYDRIGRGTVDIEAAIVSIVGSIQPGVIADYLRGAIHGGVRDDGLMQRFQMTVWPDAPTTWENVDRAPNAEAKSAANAALECLAKLTPGEVEAERDNYDRDAVPFLHFDSAAQEIFDRWRASLETRLLAGSEHPAIESHLAKYRSLIPSLALILDLLDGGVGPIGADAAEKSIRWGEYLESHARRLYAGVTEASAVAARLLAGRIQSGEVPDRFAARDVYRHGWTGLDKERTEVAIDVLVSLNWLEERIEQTEGRYRTRYIINPKIAITAPPDPTKLPKDPSGGSGSDSEPEWEEFVG